MKYFYQILFLVMTLGITTLSLAQPIPTNQTPSGPIFDPTQNPTEEIKDPFEGYNRFMFAFNDKVDMLITKPIAVVYNVIMPKPLNQGINNFFNNLNSFPTIANDILQLHLYQVLNDSWRLLINSTIGILGFFDVASRMQLYPYTNDFGLTFARWGYKNSNYFIVPFFGPNTIRDGIGIPVDYFAFSIYPYIHPRSARYELYALGVIDRRAQLLKLQPMLEEVVVDRYAFFRNAYMQHRAYQMEQNQAMGFITADKS